MIAGPSRSGAALASRTPAGAGPRARGQFSRSPPSGSLPAEPSLLMTASPPAASTRRARPWAWTSCGRLARHGCDGAQSCRGAAGKASPAMARGTLRPADAPAAGRPAGADRNQPNRRRRGRSWQPQRRARADRGRAQGQAPRRLAGLNSPAMGFHCRGTGFRCRGTQSRRRMRETVEVPRPQVLAIVLPLSP